MAAVCLTLCGASTKGAKTDVASEAALAALPLMMTERKSRDESAPLLAGSSEAAFRIAKVRVADFLAVHVCISTYTKWSVSGRRTFKRYTIEK